MSDTQWSIKVKIVELERGNTAPKNRWEKGDSVIVQIEPNATINMLKQRIAMLVAAHMSWQVLKATGNDEPLDDVLKLQDVEGLCDGGVIDLYAKAPAAPSEELGELEEDPDAMAEEDSPPPGLPDDQNTDKQLTPDEEDRQNKFKAEAAELLEDGDKEGALAKLTEAVLVGNPNAMLLVKRGELLLKMKRPKAAIIDANAALKKNPDSAKAFRLRAKAQRYLSLWEPAVADFAACQTIDYDEELKPMHDFCTKRKQWHTKKAALEAKKAAA